MSLVCFPRHFPKGEDGRITGCKICTAIAQHCHGRTASSPCTFYCAQGGSQPFKTIKFSHLLVSFRSQFVFIKSKFELAFMPDLVFFENIVVYFPLTKKNNLKNICSLTARVLTLRCLISIPKSTETLRMDVLQNEPTFQGKDVRI